MSPLPSLPLMPAPELEEYWEATKRGVLLVPHCNACGDAFWYPRTFCPFCHSEDISWTEATGGGSIFSFSVCYRGQGPWAEVGPYVIAYVQLDEGPLMLTNIVESDLDQLEIGQRVALILEDAGEYKVPRFRRDS